MGRAARRKRANGGPGFFRHAHLLAALTPHQGADEPVGVAEEARPAADVPPDSAPHAAEQPPSGVTPASSSGRRGWTVDTVTRLLATVALAGYLSWLPSPYVTDQARYALEDEQPIGPLDEGHASAEEGRR